STALRRAPPSLRHDVLLVKSGVASLRGGVGRSWRSGGCRTGDVDDVRQGEPTLSGGREPRGPLRVNAQEGKGVAREEPDEDLRDDPSTNGAEELASTSDIR